MNKILVFLAIILGAVCGYQLNNDLLTLWQRILIAGLMLFLASAFAFLDDFLSKLKDEEWKAEISRKCFQKSGEK